VDFALFGDGGRYGPDRSRTFENLQVRSTVFLELLNDLQSGRQTLSTLEQLASIEPTSREDINTAWRQRAANSLLSSARVASLSGLGIPYAAIRTIHERILRLINPK
jgi:hypothetical protein